jgi:hypothetical protein
MLFQGARSVHTFGMRFPITVVFLDTDLRVIETREVVPGRLAWNLRARHVMEVGAGERVGRGDLLGPGDPEGRTTPDAPANGPGPEGDHEDPTDVHGCLPNTGRVRSDVNPRAPGSGRTGAQGWNP